MKHQWISCSLALVALAAWTGTTRGEIRLIEYVDTSSYGNAGTRIQLSDGTTPTGNALALDNFGANPQRSFWNNATASIDDTNGVFYGRIRIDFRGGQNELLSQNSTYYEPAPGETNRWSVTWTDITAVNQAWYRMSNENWPDDNNLTDTGDPANGFVANDGVGVEEINWALVQPETVGWFPTNITQLAGNAQAVAYGILWTDTDEDGNIDTGDTLVLKYGVTAINPAGQAAAFAEIDTAEELYAAVGQVVGPGNDPPTFTSDPFSAANALADTVYSNSIAGSATDLNEDPLTYAKGDGPAWLSIAGDGALSGTPASPGDLGANTFTVSVSDGTTNATAIMTINVIEGLELADIKSISTNGDWEVSILGVPGDVSKLVEAADHVDFDAPEQDPVPLSAITLGSAYGDEVVHDAAGNATVQVNLGTNDATSVIRAEETGGTITYVLAEYLFDTGTDAGTPTQISDGSVPVGAGFVITHRNANPQYSLWDSDDLAANSRYTRWIADFRANGEIEAQGSGFFLTDSGTNLFHGPWLNTVSNTGAQVSMSTANWNDSPDASTPPNNGFVPDDGVGQEEINWAMLKPESGNFGNAGAAALGILWTDNDADGLLDLEDTYTLKYVVGAIGLDQPSAFAAMDTEEELNAAVGNVP